MAQNASMNPWSFEVVDSHYATHILIFKASHIQSIFLYSCLFKLKTKGAKIIVLNIMMW